MIPATSRTRGKLSATMMQNNSLLSSIIHILPNTTQSVEDSYALFIGRPAAMLSVHIGVSQILVLFIVIITHVTQGLFGVYDFEASSAVCWQ